MKKILLSIFILLGITINAQEAFPEWAKGIVWYQIFPERFRNGDESNDPGMEKVFDNDDEGNESWRVTPWTSSWFERSDWERNTRRDMPEVIYFRRYGGDIQGIINKLDYLENLGIDAIYLNPMFDAPSLHKYDGATYHHIDANFGPDPRGDIALIEGEKPYDPESWIWTSADELFVKLINEIHKRDMRIIIDGVFNHTGRDFFAFKDVLDKGEESMFADWYSIEQFDDPDTPNDEFDYKGWWGIKSLPEFNRDEDNLLPGPKEYIFASTKRWMDPNKDGDPSDGIDGWRLDVAREVPMGFWKEWSALVKSVNPKAYISGELWEDSPDLVGEDKPFDALMNYSFAMAVNDYFIAQVDKIKTSEFIERLKKIQLNYSFNTLLVLQNLLSSHDTDRLASMVINPDRDYDRDAREDNPDYDPRKLTPKEYEYMKLIVAFQMTYIGSPMIYYGDEVGMWGADDPHDRKPMVWDDLMYENEVIDESSGFKKGYGSYLVEQNKDLLKFYKKMIELRKRSEAIQYGGINFIYFNDEKQSFVFSRMFNDDAVLVAFNIGETADVIELDFENNKVEAEEMFDLSPLEINEKIQITVPAKSFKIYQLK